MTNTLRREVLQLYRNLLFLGRDYPKGADYFRERLKSAFMKNKDVTDPSEIRKLVDRGEFVIKELEALYFLRKYRAIKKRYYEGEH
ncbi:LYR motif-containing protein 5A [Esox lucius]|uniref:LYR motif-containing protein 5 n=1 Tax=Esox lucius TaxID=8010 RepID=C1BW71_ESOLU|nr:LYR motif-containing protein 5A [Esox lucius]XP_010885148.1 LYR motif-containing protein 5A [Esox lucius]XP_010885149.1 LYR motif-containing protein 5A [Esox lucius]XP_010885150.1 LYR motif-containing protein 5A [Esox lucius]XP_010885151.1 LYR motif-containing protein 5A [Esox lucius]XP_010885152.1 LYR motif-containing protein 5A [Esox lucius]ACO13274.1 LYR motif-containing protein 5 [Esox lucius]